MSIRLQCHEMCSAVYFVWMSDSYSVSVLHSLSIFGVSQTFPVFLCHDLCLFLCVSHSLSVFGVSQTFGVFVCQ